MDEYNPLDYRNLTVNLIRELMSRGPDALPPGERFRGAGVYALFYDGSFEPYVPFRSPAAERPIYVGKAVPKGARKGATRGATSMGTELYGRLVEHARSIGQATSLDLADFSCRFLVVTPLWITMAERFLIEEFQPVWNVCMEGFGAHDAGAGRRAGEVSWWDAMHAGRPHAAQQLHTRTQMDAMERLRAFRERLASDPAAVRAEAGRIANEQAESE